VGLAIQDVSRLLGVPAPTIRAWERRYGVPETPRSRGGHRRYSAEALHQLRLMRDEVARGRRAADAADAVRALRTRSGSSAALVDELLGYSERLDPVAVRGVLDRARNELGLVSAVDEVLLPAMRQVGLWWETGRCDVATEHLTTEAVRSWLSKTVAFAPKPTHDTALVLACGPRDLHTLGLEALAVVLSEQGWSCRVLGARTPTENLVTAVRATGASAAVVVSHLSNGRRPAAAAISAVATMGIRVFYAGNAFLSVRARTGVPGTYLGESIAEAAALIGAALDNGDSPTTIRATGRPT
jgi:DNA-binding transcriptional MerR regulator/methylmalonyl-CoA mutase cobalamin-binding subunit